MNSSEDRGVGLKGWLSGKVPKAKPHESKSGQVALDTHRIAVLPFANMSPDPSDEYFADGMTEEIISTVSGISGLVVISRTSVMGYKGTAKKVREIGKELEVGSVLEGSFRKAGDRIRVTTQLIDVATDGHLWAQNYDRTLDDIFAVQSDVAKQVAEALRVRVLSGEKERVEKKPTENTTAYALYLRGRYYWNKRDLEDLKRALEYFELAVSEDPGFVLGYVGISDCCVVLCHSWGVKPEANLERAKAMTDKALQIDPELAEAHASKALIMMGEYQLRQAEEEFRKAIELKPSYAMAHMWYANQLSIELRWDEAREQMEKALELDPLSPIIHYNHGDYYVHMRDYSKAIAPFRKAIELGFATAHARMAYTYGWMKKFDDMRHEYEAWVELSKDSVPLAQLVANLHMALFTDDKKTISQLLPEAEIHFNDDIGPSPFLIGVLHFYLGDREKGFEWLERSYSKREMTLLDIKIVRFLDGIRTDLRYIDLLKRLGLDQTAQSIS